VDPQAAAPVPPVPPSEPSSADETPPAAPVAGFDLTALPETLRGTTPDESLAKVWDAHQKLQPPKTAADYAIQFADGVEEVIGKDDAAVSLARELAHKVGMPAGQFGPFVAEFVKLGLERGVLSAPIDRAKEIELLGGPEQATARLQAGRDWLALAKQSKSLSPAAIGEIELLLVTAGGVEAFEKLRGASSSVMPSGNPAPPPMTLETLRERQRDPRYDTTSRLYDPAFRKATEDGFRALFANRSK
jgi:hypothetical protein